METKQQFQPVSTVIVLHIYNIPTRQLSEFPILLFSGCILSPWIAFALHLADNFHWHWQSFNMSLFYFFHGPFIVTGVISRQFPTTRHKTGIDSAATRSTVFTDLTAKWYLYSVYTSCGWEKPECL